MTEKYWLEISSKRSRSNPKKEYNFTHALCSPDKPLYPEMKEVNKGDRILHYNKDSNLIEGISIVDGKASHNNECLKGTDWGRKYTPPYLLVKITNYKNLNKNFHIYQDLLKKQKYQTELQSISSESPKLFYNKNLIIQQGRYLTSLPEKLINLINNAFKVKAGIDLPNFIKNSNQIQPTTNLQHPLNEFKKNVILYGPPGTGKTYITKQRSVLIIERGK